jgi:Cu-Zn family superoxide dismutase
MEETTMRRHLPAAAALAASLLALPAFAAEKTITIHAISATGVGDSIGTITAKDSRHGLVLTPKLTRLAPAGPHGFHMHEKPDCGPAPNPANNNQPAAGFAAGGHYDPMKTGKHHGPGHKEGHVGDLPVLVVSGDGSATLPMVVPHLKVKDLAGRSLMIHAGGDNYSDTPAPLGGGAGRIACGVIK